jgi:alkylhydroperoxidase/carboxymuconolactone decarboxylase family protein YurZ
MLDDQTTVLSVSSRGPRTNNKTDKGIIMKLIAMTLASLSLLASSGAQADPTKARDDVRAVAPALEKYRQDTLFGDLWKRPGLNLRDRSIVTVAALITRNQTAEMTQYLNFALDNGGMLRHCHASRLLCGLGQCHSGGRGRQGCVRRAHDRGRPAVTRIAEAAGPRRGRRNGSRQARWRAFRRGLSGVEQSASRTAKSPSSMAR